LKAAPRINTRGLFEDLQVLVSGSCQNIDLSAALPPSTPRHPQAPMLCSAPMTAPPSTSPQAIAATEVAMPDYDENGVDLTLVRYSLSLTPTQRLKAVENFMNAMASVRAVPPPSVHSAK
jgi:hypothetical protein